MSSNQYAATTTVRELAGVGDALELAVRAFSGPLGRESATEDAGPTAADSVKDMGAIP